MGSIAETPKATALVSPKVGKMKTAPPSTSSTLSLASFGCDHVQGLLNLKRDQALAQFSAIQKTIFERPSASQIFKARGSDEKATVSIIPTYMCLQCSNISSGIGREKHFEQKDHAFYIESRSGCLYCRHCRDFIYDPAFEEERLKRGRKKRTFDEMNNAEDQKLVGINSTFPPCRATGLRGLYNMGQTCFMSVIMQSLIRNPFIRSFYLSEGHRQSDCEREKEECTSCAMDEIFSEFFSSEKAEGFGAVNMLVGSWKGSPTLAGYQQQDAHEYMQFILNSLHLTASTSSPPSPSSTDQSAQNCLCIIDRTFSGLLSSTVTCSSCHNVTTASDPFRDLSLDLRAQKKRKKSEKATSDVPNESLTLQSSLKRFTSLETLPATSYKCSKCSSSDKEKDKDTATATKRLLLQKLPPVLAIHLKRFEHAAVTNGSPSTTANGTNGKAAGGSQGSGGGASAKIENKVEFPIVLDVGPYTTRAHDANISSKSTNGTNGVVYGATGVKKEAGDVQALYSLCSVVVHKGKMDSGHYVNYAKEGGEWFMFDDAKVTMVGEKEVLSAEAYLLFYVAQDI
ncbi:MAG: hypothetical protein M1820_002660 [Bogoriella megaspora]|nr:MAG: hypothetical protein M1820_002660 [Bogoriella megaspora]